MVKLADHEYITELKCKKCIKTHQYTYQYLLNKSRLRYVWYTVILAYNISWSKLCFIYSLLQTQPYLIQTVFYLLPSPNPAVPGPNCVLSTPFSQPSRTWSKLCFIYSLLPTQPYLVQYGGLFTFYGLKKMRKLMRSSVNHCITQVTTMHRRL